MLTRGHVTSWLGPGVGLGAYAHTYMWYFFIIAVMRLNCEQVNGQWALGMVGIFNTYLVIFLFIWNGHGGNFIFGQIVICLEPKLHSASLDHYE